MVRFSSLIGIILFVIFPLIEAHSLSYEVKKYDTLSGISSNFNISLDRIMVINHLEEDSIASGQKLIIPECREQREYTVMPGDSLSVLAYAFDVSVEKLMGINRLEKMEINIGQTIYLPRIPRRGETYTVEKGDTLSWISLLYDIGIGELKEWNNLASGNIRVGMSLCLEPPTADEPAEIEKRTVQADNRASDEYYYQVPAGDRQESLNYYEMPTQSIREDYSQARELLESYDRQISALPKRGSELKDWAIILDPGHGGYDSGAIVSGEDGLGRPIFVVEDEYAYDTALRLYRLLKLHGAEVHLTVISPNHIVRNGTPGLTFPHQKNEVYNTVNVPGSDDFRPIGTNKGLEMRKTLAGEYLRRSSRQKSLYLSIHADNSPNLPEGTAVLYYGSDDGEQQRSESLAETLASKLGLNAFSHEENVCVLRDNPADAAALIETRNLYFKRNCWAIRDPNLREEQAEMLTDGILEYAAGR